jgi:hypothetical protein
LLERLAIKNLVLSLNVTSLFDKQVASKLMIGAASETCDDVPVALRLLFVTVASGF